jgi:uncharacterized membrane protein (UPF0127 family)
MIRLLSVCLLLLTACNENPLLLATEIVTAHNKTIPLTLEVAASPRTREIGLMHRKTLAPNDGMIFFFPKNEPMKFWMKNTLIPLDIVFIDAAQRIVFIAHAQPLDETPVGPDIPIRTVIEIDGGRATKDGIKVGDKVRYDVQKIPNFSIR